MAAAKAGYVIDLKPGGKTNIITMQILGNDAIK